MRTDAPADLLTTAQAADYLHVHPETVRRRIRSGDLPAYRVGPRGHLGVRREDLDAYVRPYTAAAVTR